MPKFDVSFTRTDFFSVVVDAADRESAEKIALARILDSEDPFGDFNGASDGFELGEVEDISHQTNS